jgi:hypothetical protein
MVLETTAIQTLELNPPAMIIIQIRRLGMNNILIFSIPRLELDIKQKTDFLDVGPN